MMLNGCVELKRESSKRVEICEKYGVDCYIAKQKWVGYVVTNAYHIYIQKKDYKGILYKFINVLA